MKPGQIYGVGSEVFLFDVEDDDYDTRVVIVTYYSQSQNVYLIRLPEHGDDQEMKIGGANLRWPSDDDRKAS